MSLFGAPVLSLATCFSFLLDLQCQRIFMQVVVNKQQQDSYQCGFRILNLVRTIVCII